MQTNMALPKTSVPKAYYAHQLYVPLQFNGCNSQNGLSIIKWKYFCFDSAIVPDELETFTALHHKYEIYVPNEKPCSYHLIEFLEESRSLVKE